MGLWMKKFFFFFFLGNFQEVLSEERSGKLYKLVGEEGSGY